ncbi:MAG: hypothetical protein RLZZ511_4442, partial [Cyanobacteriota bacterium]
NAEQDTFVEVFGWKNMADALTEIPPPKHQPGCHDYLLRGIYQQMGAEGFAKWLKTEELIQPAIMTLLKTPKSTGRKKAA